MGDGDSTSKRVPVAVSGGHVFQQIVDPDQRIVEVWRAGDEAPELVTDILHWR